MEKYKCKYCNGKGVTENYTKLYDVKTKTIWQLTKLCVYCLGKGELDWIENIMGVDRTNAGELIQKHPSTKWADGEEKINE